MSGEQRIRNDGDNTGKFRVGVSGKRQVSDGSCAACCDEVCYLLEACDGTHADIYSNDNLLAYVGKVVLVDDICYEVSISPSVCTNPVSVAIQNTYDNCAACPCCPVCYRLDFCDGSPTIYTDSNLAGAVGKVVDIGFDSCALVSVGPTPCPATVPVTVSSVHDDCSECNPIPPLPPEADPWCDNCCRTNSSFSGGATVTWSAGNNGANCDCVNGVFGGSELVTFSHVSGANYHFFGPLRAASGCGTPTGCASGGVNLAAYQVELIVYCGAVSFSQVRILLWYDGGGNTALETSTSTTDDCCGSSGVLTGACCAATAGTWSAVYHFNYGCFDNELGGCVNGDADCTTGECDDAP